MKSQWVIRISVLAALIAAGVVFARWEPSSDAGRAGLRDDVISSLERSDIDRARVRLRRGQHSEAIEYARAALDREPEESLALYILAEAYWRRDEQGDREKAIAGFRRFDEIESVASSRYSSGSEFHRLGLIRLRIGEEESARAAFARSAEMQRAMIAGVVAEGRRGRSMWHYDLACYEARAGDREAALKAFERAIELGFTHREHAMTDADLVSIRNDPRFIAAVERIVVRPVQPELRTD